MSEDRRGAVETGRAAALVAAGIFLSRIFGLVRTRFQATFLGTETVAADSFALALRLPNFLQNLLGEGALSASFIPAYSGLLSRGDTGRAAKLAGAVFALLAMLASVVVLLGVLLAPVIVWIFTQGWEPSHRDVAVLLVRVMFPGTGLLVLSAWCLAVLNSHRKFLLSYAAPVVWNVAIILALLYGGLSGRLPESIALYAAVGAVIGSALQFLVQLPVVMRVSGGITPMVSRMSDDVRGVLARFGPAATARGSVQLSAYLDTWMVNVLPYVGRTAVLSYAQTLYQLPISLFGMAVSAAELPELSSDDGVGDGALRDSPRALELRRRMGVSMRRVLFFVVPSAVALALFGDVIIGLLYMGGRFDDADVLSTWVVLIGFTIGIVPATAGRIVATTFFAMRDTRTPMAFALTRIVVGAFLSAGFLFVVPQLLNPQLFEANPLFRVAGLSLGGSLAFWLEYALLYSAFEQRVGPPDRAPGFGLKLAVSVLVASFAGMALRYTLDPGMVWVFRVGVLAGFGVVFLVLAEMFRISELSSLLGKLRRR